MPSAVPAAILGGLQEKARPRADVEQLPAPRPQNALEGFQPVGLCQNGPVLILAGMGQEGRLLFGVVVFAVFALQRGRIGQRNGVAESRTWRRR